MASHAKPLTDAQKERYAHYLSPGEKMVHFTGFSKIYLFRRLLFKFIFPGILIIVAVTAGGYVLGYPLVYALLAGYAAALLVALVINYFTAKGTQYILTDRRVIMQKGYFNVSLTSAAYDKITHVDVRQSFIERSMYHYGKVVVHTAGSKNREIVIKYVAHPMHFKNLMEKLIDEAGHREPRWKQVEKEGIRRIHPGSISQRTP